MKALSVQQPWAWLICKGWKDIENRTWRIGRKPGPGMMSVNWSVALPIRVCIHAGKKFDLEAMEYIKDRVSIVQWDEFERSIDNMALGALIGELDIVGCVSESDSRWFVGPYGFQLAKPTLYDKPIFYPGRLGFFDVPDELPK